MLVAYWTGVDGRRIDHEHRDCFDGATGTAGQRSVDDVVSGGEAVLSQTGKVQPGEGTMRLDESEARQLSKLLFCAMDDLSMWRDVVEQDSGKPATGLNRAIQEIADFRSKLGWSPSGFGGEGPVDT